MPSRGRILLWAVWGASILASYYLGGVVGFNRGVSTEFTLSSDGAVETVIALRALRAGKVDQVTEFLEVLLDGQIATGVYGEEAYCSAYNVPMRFAFPLRTAVHASHMSAVLRYRKEHKGPDTPGKQELMRRLSRYENAPRVDLSGRSHQEGSCWPR